MRTSKSKLFLTAAAALLAGTMSVAAQDGGPLNERDRTGATTDSSMTSAYPRFGRGYESSYMGRRGIAREGADAYAYDGGWGAGSQGIIGFGFGGPSWDRGRHHQGGWGRY